MKRTPRDRFNAVRPEIGAAWLLSAAYLAAIVVASVAMILLCGPING
jgi:hypothetical protein